MMKILCSAAIACAASQVVVSAAAQDYPVKPVRVALPVPAGGPPDVLARTVTPSKMESAAARLESIGSAQCGQISRTRADPSIERKYSDPNGFVFDIVTPEHARPVWGIPG
jgi:hypothetical protein